MYTVLQQTLHPQWQTVAIVGVAVMFPAKFAVLEYLMTKLKDTEFTDAL